jgi:hypothetical protein
VEVTGLTEQELAIRDASGREFWLVGPAGGGVVRARWVASTAKARAQHAQVQLVGAGGVVVAALPLEVWAGSAPEFHRLRATLATAGVPLVEASATDAARAAVPSPMGSVAGDGAIDALDVQVPAVLGAAGVIVAAGMGFWQVSLLSALPAVGLGAVLLHRRWRAGR